jgi:hypothetical protein
MKKLLRKAITIDTFGQYQNGNLIIDFYNQESVMDEDPEYLEKYADSRVLKKLDLSKPEDKSYFMRLVSAFENFQRFLTDDEVVIDHTYLWDIISMPNRFLFPMGVNLVIFHIPKDDITNNIEVLCPTNHYSSEFYQARKPTVLLIKDGPYYEPIYLYTTSKKAINVAKDFKEYDPHLSKKMKTLFQDIIKPLFSRICAPHESMPAIYRSKRAIPLDDLISKLNQYSYSIEKFVLHFDGKVIGVIASKATANERQNGFVPCYPSAFQQELYPDVDYSFMNDPTLWDTYENTVDFLLKLNSRSKKRRQEADIPCKPAFKVVEDELIVGVLTETNQFIQVSQPVALEDVQKDLIPVIKNDSYMADADRQADAEIVTQMGVDEERVEYIRKIQLETSFYNIFRNTLRVLLNKYENAAIKQQIEATVANRVTLYSDKLRTIDDLLRKLVKDRVQFTGDRNYYKLIQEVTLCAVKDNSSCRATPNLCMVSESGECNIILPRENLMTHKENERIYYGRVSDELVRYTRIQSFMFDQRSYLSFGAIGYDLRENEMILIESLLTHEYFENLVPAVTNQYVKSNSYDEVNPILHQDYDNRVLLDDIQHASTIGKKQEAIACEKTVKNEITSGIWKSCFPANYMEVTYEKTVACGFYMIIELIEQQTTQKLSLHQVKEELLKEYSKYSERFIEKILDILMIEGKHRLGMQVKAGTLTFSNFIYADNYFLTTLDLWMLVVRFQIPTIFISQKPILETDYKTHEFVAYQNTTVDREGVSDGFAFIVVPAFRAESIPSYKRIVDENSGAMVSLQRLPEGDCREKLLRAMTDSLSIEEYLLNFSKPRKTEYVKKGPVRLVIQDTVVVEPSAPPEIEKTEKRVKKLKKKLKIVEEEEPEAPNMEEVAEKPSRKTKKLVLRGNNKTKKFKIVEE